MKYIPLKATAYILLCLFQLFHLDVWSQQFYLRGEVKDENGTPLQNATILNIRSGYVYKSGTTGSFAIITTQQLDSFKFSYKGFTEESFLLDANNFALIKLKKLPASVTGIRQNKLASLTKGMAREEHRQWFAGDETYMSLVENRFVNTGRFNNTGLSLNIDRASYSNTRRFLTQNSKVPPDAVRTEEMLNYFNLNYIPPVENELFGIRTRLTTCPWNEANQLYFINLSARKLDLEKLPPTHLVFLIDVSGSMDMTNRLPLLKSAFKLLVGNLRARDSVSIVVYGGVTGVMLNALSGIEKDSIIRVIDGLEPGGSTPGESGIKLAYSVAKRHFIPGGNNRVILATDGDFNVGLRTEEELEDMISMHSKSGIYLTCLGVGMGNYKDSKIQTLARKGNGNFAYIDNFNEAEKVLMKEFTQTLYAVADDAYMNVEFNPQYVKEYRLIGFDNKVGSLIDTMAIVEGGEIGSGYSMMGIFEIVPIKSDTVNFDRFARIQLQYRLPSDTARKIFNWRSPYIFEPFTRLEKTYRFSATVALFGAMLRESAFVNPGYWNLLSQMAMANADPADKLQAEFVQLVNQAKVIYTAKKKKRGRKKQEDEE